MPTEFAIVDLFAGPGGLAEGFSSIRSRNGSRPFQIALSVEKEASAFETLRFRSFFRQFDDAAPIEYYRFLNGETPEPDWESLYPIEWKRACLETLKLELGSPAAAHEIDARLAQITKSYRGNVILIGGPPCQAYSLVGRARNKGTEGYEASKDHRHFLYREYIRILQRLMPAAFVMENVKGLLSSSVNGELIFDQVLDDLSKVGNGSYRLVPLAPRSGQSFFDRMVHPPAVDFVVRAEDHGIPQSRHRVIIVGVRADIAAGLNDSQISAALLPQSQSPVMVRDVLMRMPRLRSGLSGGDDSEETWQSKTSRIMRDVSKSTIELPDDNKKAFKELGQGVALGFSTTNWHPEFGEAATNFEPGTVLALDDELIMHVGRDKLAQIETIFTIAKAEELTSGTLNVFLDSEKIKILVAADVYDTVNRLRALTHGKPIILNSVYLSAVMQVLDSLRDGAGTFESRRWYRVFDAKCTHLNINTADPDLWQDAQKILQSPFLEIHKSREILDS